MKHTFTRPRLRVRQSGAVGDLAGPFLVINADNARLSPLDVRALVFKLEGWLGRIGYDPENPGATEPPERNS